MGDASVAYAIGAILIDIQCAGGWSTNSTVLEAKYIDFTMKPSLAAWIFFGYLYRGTYPPRRLLSPLAPRLRVLHWA